MLKIKQYLCFRHEFKLIARHEEVQEQLYLCSKCGVYQIIHYGIGVSYKCKIPNIKGWTYIK